MPRSPAVLVVEDHMELRDVLLDALEWEGYETLAASDAARAVAILRKRPISLLVADPSPFDGGEAALAALEAEFPDLPIVALEAEDSSPGLYFGPWSQIGNRRTLKRPFRLHDLLAACREAIGPLEEPEAEDEDGS